MWFKKLFKGSIEKSNEPACSPDKDSTVVVPEPSVIRHECKVDDFSKYDKFDLLHEDCKLGIVRIANENAKELARIKYLVHQMDAKSICLDGNFWQYLTCIEDTEQVARLFITKKGRLYVNP